MAPPVAEENRAVDPLELRIREEVQVWDGTPYRWGGTLPTGADCSGFVMSVYRDVFGLVLPRSTAEQVEVGTPVSRRALRAGDLVFFRLASKGRHVGIYLSDGEFAHVSTSAGVTVSRLEEPYWDRAYWTSRRVLDGMAGLGFEAPREPARAHPLSVRPVKTDEDPAAPSSGKPDRVQIGW